jgi:elongation factor Ts
MAEITAALVKQLREKTEAGMMDCKRALTVTAGDFEAAVDWLRTKGLAAASKKSGRVAAEGLVAAALASGTEGVLVEINSETDFVGRNEIFQQLVQGVATVALTHHESREGLLAAQYPGTGRNVGDEVAHHIAVIGENIQLRRVASLSVSQGVVISYVHNAVVPNLGKIGVLVGLESSAPKEKLETIAKQLAMHIAAAKPEVLSASEVSEENLLREKEIFREQAKASGKPAEIIEKMVEGRVRKYYEEVVLLEQVFVLDNKSKVSQVVEALAKELGTAVTLKGFVRFLIGEGIEQEKSDFASEVAAMSKA